MCKLTVIFLWPDRTVKNRQKNQSAIFVWFVFKETKDGDVFPHERASHDTENYSNNNFNYYSITISIHGVTDKLKVNNKK